MRFGLFDFDTNERVGGCVLLREREAKLPAGNPALYEQHRVALFRADVPLKGVDGATYEFVVATLFLDRELGSMGSGEYAESKVTRGFNDINAAEAAFAEYGPTLLAGAEVGWVYLEREPSPG
jgi:hypothetical protein